jgi:hypothetical protein
VLSHERLSLGELARRELLADPGRADRQIAALIGCSRTTVARVRRRMAGAGLVQGARPAAPAIHALAPWPGLDGALCMRHPQPDLWSSHNRRERERAKAICASCPVLAQCLEWSLSLPCTDATIWAGLGWYERNRLQRERQAQAS